MNEVDLIACGALRQRCNEALWGICVSCGGRFSPDEAFDAQCPVCRVEITRVECNRCNGRFEGAPTTSPHACESVALFRRSGGVAFEAESHAALDEIRERAARRAALIEAPAEIAGVYTERLAAAALGSATHPKPHHVDVVRFVSSWRGLSTVAASFGLIVVLLVVQIGSGGGVDRNVDATSTRVTASSARVAPAPKTRGHRLQELLSKVGPYAESELEEVLLVAQSGSGLDIEASALGAGRGFDFAEFRVSSNSVLANRLNAQALEMFNAQSNFLQAYELQAQAFEANPYNQEVAGNFAIYAFRVGRYAEAMKLVRLALVLPRPETKTGRTADWATLAAIYSKLGDEERAARALYVTLGIAPNIEKRCYSAVYSVMKTYGEVLQPATERMLSRIQTLGLSHAPACRIPVDWSVVPSLTKFEAGSKLTINGMNPLRVGSSNGAFKLAFARELNSLDCYLGQSAHQRICGIRENYLGDVNGALVIEKTGAVDQVVGIEVRDPAVATPSGIAVDALLSDIYRVYGSKYALKTVNDELVRLPGVGVDSKFEMRFGISAGRINYIACVLSSAFAYQELLPEQAQSVIDVVPEEVFPIDSVVLTLNKPFKKMMRGRPYTSPPLVLSSRARAEDFTFSIESRGGEVRVSVTAIGGNFSYVTSEVGVSNCRFGPWLGLSVTNISARSVAITLKRRRSPCA